MNLTDMNLTDLAVLLQRAFTLTLNKKKLLFTAVVIAVCGLFTIFFMSLAFSASHWMAQSLTFLPVFISGMILTGFGVVLVRTYHDEVKQQEIELMPLFLRSWDVCFSAASAFLLLLLSYLVLWIALGIFIVFKELPIIGEIFACVFVFIPFLLNMAIVALGLFSVYAVYVLSPAIALKSVVPQQFLQLAKEEFTSHIISRLMLFLTALLPFFVSLGLLIAAASMTLEQCGTSSHLQVVMQWFFLILPSALLLAPSVVFFFNMAAESHVLIHKFNSAGEQ
ncbi:MAG: hypothetical protein JSR46_05055 [Verrucomicrobia bacterium]|nr:hypothetical protein [Verrucomicrobiota bacterium]